MAVLGYETCGLEILVFPLFTWPVFILGLFIRLGLLFRWKFPPCVWYLPPILCGLSSCCWRKSLEMGIFCIVSMVILPVVDLIGSRKAIRR